MTATMTTNTVTVVSATAEERGEPGPSLVMATMMPAHVVPVVSVVTVMVVAIFRSELSTLNVDIDGRGDGGSRKGSGDECVLHLECGDRLEKFCLQSGRCRRVGWLFSECTPLYRQRLCIEYDL